MSELEQRKRILIIEDEAMIQQVLRICLKCRDFNVLGVSSGQEAMRVIPEFKPHLIILDLLMHPISGWDVLHWLRAKRLTPHIPVLVISALVHLTEQMQGFEEGAIEYIPKPTQPSIIVERVHTLLAMSAKQRSMFQHKRINEQRDVLRCLAATQFDEFLY